jgi:hypothetical protein
MDKIESLLRVIESKNNYIGSWIKYYSEGGNLYDAKGKVGLVTLWNHYQCLSLKAIFIDHDFEAARQHYFTCGKLDEFAIVKQVSLHLFRILRLGKKLKKGLRHLHIYCNV